jgi:ankyrin repeat protein
MISTPEVVKCLVDHGARITARLADGKNSLHLAASRGDVEIIKILMEKSIENEEAEEERQDKKRQAAKISKSDGENEASKEEASKEDNDESDVEMIDVEMVDDETTDVDAVSMTTGSFVKVKQGEEGEVEDLVPDEAQDEPDFFNVDALAWDLQCSPLHLAIAEGKEDAVKLLCDVSATTLP